VIRISIAALVVVAALGSLARAGGVDCDDEVMPTALKELEASLRDRSNDAALAYQCLPWATPKFKARIGNVCEKILDRDGDKSECVGIAAQNGFTVLGKHDIFALVAKSEEDPLEMVDPFKVWQLEKMSDARGAQVLVDMWNAAQPRADAREKRHGTMTNWSAWRQAAAHALGALGSLRDADVLEQKAAATRDAFVAKACRDAATAIRARQP
jgi:hypothetical protein